MNRFIRKYSGARSLDLDSHFRKYEQTIEIEDIESYQLRRVQDVWEHALRDSEFYRWWQSKHNLPSKIGSLEELTEFPSLTKSILTENQELVFNHRKRGRVYSTGGSTGEPTVFPAARHERIDRYLSNYVGRAWWEIKPKDRSVLAWGHSHLYGTGLTGRLNHVKRSILDALVNRRRLDGYDASRAAAIANLEAICNLSPTYLIGYTSAIYRIALEADDDQRRRLSSRPMKGVVLTAETAAAAEVEIIRSTFNCPVLIEYGAAEAGVMAFSRQTTWDIQVLWMSHVINMARGAGIHVTTLGPRRFPLINYATEDTGNVSRYGSSGNALAFSSIDGRTADRVVFQDKNLEPVPLVAIQPVHVLKGYPGVRSVQFEQFSETRLKIYVDLTSPDRIDDLRKYFSIEMRRRYPEIDTTSITFINDDDPHKSVSGKHLLFRNITP